MKLKEIRGISSRRIEALGEAGIKTAGDLLNFFPRRYIDRRRTLPIGNLTGFGEEVTVIGKITHIYTAGRGRKRRLEVTLEDDSGKLKGVWFRGIEFYRKTLKTGQLVAFFGTVKQFGRSLSMAHPDVEKLSDEDQAQNVANIVPVYPGSKFFKNTYITSHLLQQWILNVLDSIRIDEFLPPKILNRLELPEREQAYRMIHAPENLPEFASAQQRFKFEELFLFQLSLMRLKFEIQERPSAMVMDQIGTFTRRFFNDILPFELTGGQKSALHAIKEDLNSGRQMNRLIQGDVGSGKTVVAVGAILMALDNGYQAAFMAPTEILAEQHFRTLRNYLDPLGINIRLLVGNQKSSLREDILTDIASGRCHITVGTHAIIQKEVRYARLGLAVIDEQHRFGVLQRGEMLQKGSNPHLLVMSATPIPRSLAMTIFGELDVSVIRELPAGRIPIRTAIRGESSREKVYNFVDKVIRQQGQAYIVYPLVEESEALDLKDATMGYEQIKHRFPGTGVGLLHGRLAADEKDRVMRDFLDNKIQILVSTTVIEVGVDVPNATLMIIEHAERFGLSQLHQLRGRIGRGNRQSYCILMVGFKQSKEARTRLKAMETTSDGFKIAETDLELRGPGDFLGTRQSGLPDFRLANIVEDQELLLAARDEAIRIIHDDPDLKQPEHQSLKRAFEPFYRARSKFYQMS